MITWSSLARPRERHLAHVSWVTPGPNDELWGTHGPWTYKKIAYEALPPVATDGSFAWLEASATHKEGMRLTEDSDPIDEHLSARVAEARQSGLTVPPSFVSFMTDASLHSRVPSCTACYF